LGRALASEEQTLPGDVLAEVTALLDQLPPDRAVTKALRVLLPVESASEPQERALEVLSEQLPRFLLFTGADRELNSAYDLTASAPNPDPALRNLARLAKLDLLELSHSVAQGLTAQAETMIEKSNENLRQSFTTRWSQSGLEVRLNRDGNTLRIFAGNRDTENGYVNIAERSDGMRWFVSLLSFLAERNLSVPPILLVDEAETHLHYDAQADLMQMLGRQSFASKVIYSTHSAGCLPEDLGAGIRAIRPEKSRERSKVENWVWSGRGNLGLTPLLLAMGASALAFTPARRAVITEGTSDFILLPTLMREATGKEVLGFQFAPGASEAGLADLINIESDAAHVAYLLDGDPGGKAIEKKLIGHGIPKGRIHRLPSGSVVEDYVADNVYLDSVNEELARSNGVSCRMPRSSLPRGLRQDAVVQWCRKQGVSAPNKRAVAINVLQAGYNGKAVLRPSKRAFLVRLFDQLAEQFRKPIADE
jgi:hypothetical protein